MPLPSEMQTAAQTKKVFLLGHPVCESICEQEMVDALPEPLRPVVRRAIMLDSNRMPVAELADANWTEAQRNELDQFTTHVRPLLQENPDAQVCYFGLAPIPIAMYIGYLFGTARSVAAFQKHHVTQSWYGRVPVPSPREGFVQVTDDLHGVVAARGEAIIRVSVSYKVERQETLAIVPEPLAEVDVSVPVTGPDSVHDTDALESVAVAFRTALDRIKQFRPNTTVIHVFASVPVGVAFKLGARVSPTIHPEIMTYQYVNRAPEKYRPAFALLTAPQVSVEMKDEDRLRTAHTRALWCEEVRRLATFATTLQRRDSNAPAWLESLFPGIGETLPHASACPDLSCLQHTELPKSAISDVPATPEDGFRYSRRDQSWHFSDELIHAFNTHFTDEKEIQRAGRLLLLHEAIHLSDHGLTDATSIRIGRFPKLLEDADYFADVWAFLHEFRFARSILNDTSTIRQLFTSIIETAIKSFWAFDDNGRDQTEIQVRRIHRYLNWYWQALHMESIDSEGGWPVKL